MSSTTTTNPLTGIPMIGLRFSFKTINKAVKFDSTCHLCGTVVEAGTGKLVKLETFNLRNGRSHDMWAGAHDKGGCADSPNSNTVAFRTEDDTAHFVPVFRSGAVNKRDGACGNCGVNVPEGEGVLGKGPDGKFFTRHNGPCG